MKTLMKMIILSTLLIFSFAISADKLLKNQSIGLNQSLVSPNGTHELVFQGDGNLVLLNSDRTPTWSTDTHNKGANRLIFQGDGNLVIYTVNNSPIWASGTHNEGAEELAVQDNGLVVIKNASGTIVWQQGIEVVVELPKSSLVKGEKIVRGEELISPDGSTTLAFQGDGNLVLYKDGVAKWASHTHNQNGTRVVLQSDGNLVMYTDANNAIWSTGTHNLGVHILNVKDYGVFKLENENGVDVWVSNEPTQTPDPDPNAPYFISKGGLITDRVNHKVFSSDANNGDYEIVQIGASDGGDESRDVNVSIDANLMLNQGFKLIVASGSRDKKVEVWARINSGQRDVKITGDAKDVTWTIITFDRNKINFNLNNIDVATKQGGGHNSEFGIVTPGQSGIKILTVFFDDPVKVLDAKNGGTILHRQWGHGDGDGYGSLIWEEGQNVPNTITVQTFGGGARQYVMATIRITPL